MHPQKLLTKLANQYDLEAANQLLSHSGIRQFVRGWLALDLSIPLSEILKADRAKFSQPYQHEGRLLKYCAEEDCAEPCEKRSASKADLVLSAAGVDHYFEFHYLHQSQITQQKSVNKLFQDVNRVRAMRRIDQLNVNLIIALWGAFSVAEIDIFKSIDINQDAAYALDTALKGSSQIARFLHIRKAGEGRLILVAV